MLHPRPQPWTTWPPWKGSLPGGNLCLVGPAGTGKSHVLVSVGISAVHAASQPAIPTACARPEHEEQPRRAEARGSDGSAADRPGAPTTLGEHKLPEGHHQARR
jgi:hypothetical protein